MEMYRRVRRDIGRVRRVGRVVLSKFSSVPKTHPAILYIAAKRNND